MPRRRNPPALELQPERRHKNGSTEKAVWIVKYYDEGKGRQAVLSTGYSTGEGEEAQRYFARWLTERTADEPLPKNRAVGEVPLADVLAHFIDERIDIKPGDGRKPFARPKEVLKYVLDLIEWWGDKTVAEVNKANCREYWKACTSLNAARNRLEYLRLAINLARTDDLIDTMVVVHLPEKPEPRDEIFDRSDIARMLRYCLRKRTYDPTLPKRDWTTIDYKKYKKGDRPWRHLMPYFIMALYTGSRSGPMLTASFTRQKGRPWIDLETGTFHRGIVGKKTAQNKQATSIRIPLKLLRYMRRWNAAGAAYPIEWRGQPITKSKGIGKVVKACCPDKDVVAHTYRHTAATWMMRYSELSIHDIAGFLGMTMETLDRVYGKHRTHHQVGIDGVLSSGGFGRAPSETRTPPGDTMGNNQNMTASTQIKAA